MERTEVIGLLERALDDFPGVVAAYLYGSRGRGDGRRDSDVDLGVLFSEAPPGRLESPVTELESLLEQRLGLPVQVVALNTAPPDLIHRILRDGQIVHDRDAAQRVRFEVGARNRFFDLLPHLTLYRKVG